MPMKSIAAFWLTAVLVAAPALTNGADSRVDYAGDWTVRWLSNDSLNALSLTQSGDTFAGKYTSDDGEECAVSGSYVANVHAIKLRIVCKKWDIKMDGYGSADGKLIAGKYLAYGDSVGGYTVSKKK
jgi:hypothetical protein